MLRMATALAERRPGLRRTCRPRSWSTRSGSPRPSTGAGLWDEDGRRSTTTRCACRTARRVPLKVHSMIGLLPDPAGRVGAPERRPSWAQALGQALRPLPGDGRHDRATTSGCAGRSSPAPGHDRLGAQPAAAGPSRAGAPGGAVRGRVPVAARPAGALAAPSRRAVQASTSRASPPTVDYEPGESTNDLFGGNSNWRGPVWFPVNYLFIESLMRWDAGMGETFTVEYPTGSGRPDAPARRGARTSPAGWSPSGCRTQTAAGRCTAPYAKFRTDPEWRDLLLVPRVLPRRHGRRHRRLAPDRLDGPRGPPARVAAARWTATRSPTVRQRHDDDRRDPRPARGRRPRGARRELARRVHAAVADALPAPVELGLGVHRPRPRVVRRGAGPAGAAVAVPRPVGRRPRAAHRVQPVGGGGGLLPGPGVLAVVEASAAAPRDVETSGITQPPIHARAALEMHRHARDVEGSKAFLGVAVPAPRRRARLPRPAPPPRGLDAAGVHAPVGVRPRQLAGLGPRPRADGHPGGRDPALRPPRPRPCEPRRPADERGLRPVRVPRRRVPRDRLRRRPPRRDRPVPDRRTAVQRDPPVVARTRWPRSRRSSAPTRRRIARPRAGSTTRCSASSGTRRPSASARSTWSSTS